MGSPTASSLTTSSAAQDQPRTGGSRASRHWPRTRMTRNATPARATSSRRKPVARPRRSKKPSNSWKAITRGKACAGCRPRSAAPQALWHGQRQGHDRGKDISTRAGRARRLVPIVGQHQEAVQQTEGGLEEKPTTEITPQEQSTLPAFFEFTAPAIPPTPRPPFL